MLKHILSAVQKHAAAEYPRECCGLIIRSGRSQRYVPYENTSADAGEEFRIAPEAYAEAEDQGEIVAVVHSHPDATSRPSAADVAMCNASGLTWHILSWPEGDLRTIEPVDQVPLLGRAFVHGVQDCWQVCADWYQREWGIEFPHFERADGWWERADGPSLYEQRFEGRLHPGGPAAARRHDRDGGGAHRAPEPRWDLPGGRPITTWRGCAALRRRAVPVAPPVWEALRNHRVRRAVARPDALGAAARQSNQSLKRLGRRRMYEHQRFLHQNHRMPGYAGSSARESRPQVVGQGAPSLRRGYRAGLYFCRL